MEIKRIESIKELNDAINLFEDEYGNMLYRNFGFERYKNFVLNKEDAKSVVINGFSNKDYKGYIIYEKGVVVGMAIYMMPNYIRMIAVKTGYNRKGLGTKLINEMSNDITSNEMIVHAAAPSEYFYIINGFKRIGELEYKNCPYYPMKKQLK